MDFPRLKKKLSSCSTQSNQNRRTNSTHSIKETYKIIKGFDQEGRTTINQYTFVKKLGEGAFSKVKLAVKHDTSEKFAIKILKKSFLKKKKEYIRDEKGMKVKDALQDVMREIAIMKKLDHKNVIKLHEVIDDPEEDKLFMILDYAEKGQMIDWNETDERFYFTPAHPREDDLSEEYLRKTFRDIVKGLYYLHNNGIIHRDLKPQNIVFDEENNAKIGDFGVSYLMEDSENDKLKSTAGTYHFMAPESINPVTKRNGYSGRMADLWGLGITLFSFVFQEVPFRGGDVFELLENIENQELKFPAKREISKDLMNLLQKLLEKDPQKRITMNEILDDEWLNLGFDTKLKTEIDHDIVEITESDIKNALIPLHTIVFLKKFVKNWRERSSSRSNSPQSDGGNPLSNNQIMRRSGKSVYSKLNTIKPQITEILINKTESTAEIDRQNSITISTDLKLQTPELNVSSHSPQLRKILMADNNPFPRKKSKIPSIKNLSILDENLEKSSKIPSIRNFLMVEENSEKTPKKIKIPSFRKFEEVMEMRGSSRKSFRGIDFKALDLGSAGKSNSQIKSPKKSPKKEPKAFYEDTFTFEHV